MSSSVNVAETPTTRLHARRRVLALVVIVVAANIGVLMSRSSDGLVATDPEGTATEAAEGFVARYVSSNGRVVRLDEGGDTVSEGQAYAMLLAVGADDRPTFDRIWRWTRANLQRPDGLLSWRWEGGEVADPEPASDADLDAIRALLLASERFGDRSFRREAMRMADGLFRLATAPGPNGPVLLAGPWAADADPPYVNPSYFSPVAYEMLAEAGGGERWDELRRSSYVYLEAVVAEPTRLPPDWAILGEAAMRPASAPERDASPRYGLDAARVPIRLAEDCSERGRALAASLWPLLRSDPEAGLAYELTGEVVQPGPHPTMLVAAAAAAAAAGETDAASELLTRAAELDDLRPTYYGAAWVALGRVILSTDRLGGCAT